MLDAPPQRVAVRQAGVGGARDQEPPHGGNQVQIPLPEQIGGVVGDVIVGEAAPSLVRARQHRRRELALRLHIKQGPKVNQVNQVLDDGVVLRFGTRFGLGFGLRLWFGLGFLLLVVVAFEGEVELFGECEGERGSKLLELVDE